MARRNLLAEAQVQAAAQVAPQVAALSEALQQAKSDRNSAIGAAATAYHGLSGAIHRAGPEQRRVFTDAQKGAAGSDLIARQTLSGLSSSPGVDTIKAAYAHEGAVGGAVVAKALASRLADLSDKRIAAAAGRAFSVVKANTDLSAAEATIGNKRQAVAAQQGLATGAALSKLEEAAATRANARNLLRTRLQSQASLQSQRLNSQASLQSQRLTSQEAVAGQRIAASNHNAALGRRQQKLGRVDRAKLQTQRLQAQGSTGKNGSGPKPSASHVYAGRQSILAWKGAYDQAGAGNMHSVAGQARGKAVPEPIIGAAADLSSKGYITPQNVQKLAQLGVSVPKQWTGVQVQPHTRKRPGG